MFGNTLFLFQMDFDIEDNYTLTPPVYEFNNFTKLPLTGRPNLPTIFLAGQQCLIEATTFIYLLKCFLCRRHPTGEQTTFNSNLVLQAQYYDSNIDELSRFSGSRTAGKLFYPDLSGLTVLPVPMLSIGERLVGTCI
jgi:hypothetical protein